MQKRDFSPLFILFTGLSGAGKSTLAKAIYQKLFEAKIASFILDGDHLRKGINKDLGFSQNDRKENLRRMAEISKILMDSGLVVLAAFIAPYHESRQYVKEIVGSTRYVEVYVNTSLETCIQRDTKGLYDKAKRGEISNMTGIQAPYEPPIHPTLEIKEACSIPIAVQKIYHIIHQRLMKVNVHNELQS